MSSSSPDSNCASAPPRSWSSGDLVIGDTDNPARVSRSASAPYGQSGHDNASVGPDSPGPPPLPPMPASLRTSTPTLIGPRHPRERPTTPHPPPLPLPLPQLPPSLPDHALHSGTKIPSPALPPKITPSRKLEEDSEISQRHWLPPLPPKIPIPKIPIHDGVDQLSLVGEESSVAFEEEMQRAMNLSAEHEALERQRLEQEEHELARAMEESARLHSIQSQYEYQPSDVQRHHSESVSSSSSSSQSPYSPGQSFLTLDGQLSPLLNSDDLSLPEPSRPQVRSHLSTGSVSTIRNDRASLSSSDNVIRSGLESGFLFKPRLYENNTFMSARINNLRSPSYEDLNSPTKLPFNKSSLCIPESAALSPPIIQRSVSSQELQRPQTTHPQVHVFPEPYTTESPASPTPGLVWEKLGIPTTVSTRTPSPQNGSTMDLIETELLQGVSIGFNPPMISPSSLFNLPRGMPRTVLLPYGKSPPLHILAPSWRQMLKLMARLSDTRIEPSVEAMAVVKTEIQLRTVVQFVRVHHSSSDWRTILYLTIDHPVPARIPNASKYTVGDVNTLPWSYTLSSLPTLLHDGPDALLTKSYTIPKTYSTPYPTLPINMPTLAMYLQAALEDSRKTTNDSYGGLRKLSRLIDTFYPATQGNEDGFEDDTSKKGIFRNPFGRGKNLKDRGRGNADTFELITPFRLDEWG